MATLHPLKILCISSISSLILAQIGLIFWLETDYRYYLSIFLLVPLLIPFNGLLSNKLFTFKWVGFLTMPYFLIGVSESFATTDFRQYGVITAFSSAALFVSSIYYSRYLRSQNI